VDRVGSLALAVADMDPDARSRARVGGFEAGERRAGGRIRSSLFPAGWARLRAHEVRRPREEERLLTPRIDLAFEDLGDVRIAVEAVASHVPALADL
jgi:hypothetical protein